MAVFSADVVVPAAPRDAVERIIRRLHDIAALLRFDAESKADLGEIARAAEAAAITGIVPETAESEAATDPGTDVVRLVEGTHLRPGARYLISDGTVACGATVVEWDPAEETSLRLEFGPGLREELTPDERARYAASAEEGEGSADAAAAPTGTVFATLRGADAPSLLEVQGDLRLPGWRRRLVGGAGTLRADLSRWWEQAKAPVQDGVPAPVTCTLTHLFAVAEVTLAPRAAAQGMWQLRVTAKVRGRLVARPVAALVLWWLRARIAGGFQTAVTAYAEVLSEGARGLRPPEERLREVRDQRSRLRESAAEGEPGDVLEPETERVLAESEERLAREIAYRRSAEEHWDELGDRWEALHRTIREQASLGRAPATRWADDFRRQETEGRRPWEQWQAWARDFEAAGFWWQRRFAVDVIADGLAER